MARSVRFEPPGLIWKFSWRYSVPAAIDNGLGPDGELAREVKVDLELPKLETAGINDTLRGGPNEVLRLSRTV